jgi:predicted RNA binding protein YcfA (HicA-like mRNA interferase family)
LKGFGKQVRKILEQNGCTFLRAGRGDHEVWTSPHSQTPFTVPVKIMSRHTANNVLKDAGLTERIR